mmetsp:Transcript_69263/g.183843  ORF Transcript_69263/g.183843 Transcript_69263/m.183843 type:complete len:490 (+) Transcript_69263:88-1557(+)
MHCLPRSNCVREPALVAEPALALVAEVVADAAAAAALALAAALLPGRLALALLPHSLALHRLHELLERATAFELAQPVHHHAREVVVGTGAAVQRPLLREALAAEVVVGARLALEPEAPQRRRAAAIARDKTVLQRGALHRRITSGVELVEHLAYPILQRLEEPGHERGPLLERQGVERREQAEQCLRRRGGLPLDEGPERFLAAPHGGAGPDAGEDVLQDPSLPEAREQLAAALVHLGGVSGHRGQYLRQPLHHQRRHHVAREHAGGSQPREDPQQLLRAQIPVGAVLRGARAGAAAVPGPLRLPLLPLPLHEPLQAFEDEGAGLELLARRRVRRRPGASCRRAAGRAALRRPRTLGLGRRRRRRGRRLVGQPPLLAELQPQRRGARRGSRTRTLKEVVEGGRTQRAEVPLVVHVFGDEAGGSAPGGADLLDRRGHGLVLQLTLHEYAVHLAAVAGLQEGRHVGLGPSALASGWARGDQDNAVSLRAS